MKLLLAVLPPLILILTLYVSYSKRDDILGFTMMKVFLLGMLIIYPVSLFEQNAIPSFMVMDAKGILYSNFIVVGGIEELAKMVLAYYAIKYGQPTLKKPTSVALIVLAAASGFSLLENIIYVHDGGYLTALLRAMSSIPMHASTAIVIGYFASKEVLGEDPYGWIKGLFIAIFMHGLYNSYAAYFNSSEWFVGVFILAFCYTVLANSLLKKLKDLSESKEDE